MTTYADYQAQITELKKQAEAARKAEIEEAKSKIWEIINAHGLAISDLNSSTKAAPKSSRAAVPAKYRDPLSGSEWTGRGRAPLWLAGKDKADYLIK